jgi:hypothetical protein
MFPPSCPPIVRSARDSLPSTGSLGVASPASQVLWNLPTSPFPSQAPRLPSAPGTCSGCLVRSAGGCTPPTRGLVRGRRWTHPEWPQERGDSPRFLGNPCACMPRSSTPVGRLVLATRRTSRCCLPAFQHRRPPQDPYFRGSITRPACALSPLHDAGRPNAVQDSLPVCWRGVDGTGLAPAGFQSRISRRSHWTSFPIEPGLSWRTKNIR